MAEEIMGDSVAINIIDNIENAHKSVEDISFDEIIGHIEDLLLEEEFHSIQQKFLEEYWDTFESTEENKLIYTDIFNEYNKTVENYIENYLKKVIPSFKMNMFLDHLNDKRDELEGEVFEVLLTFTDFMAFKEMFLDYRAVKEGKVDDLSSHISITSFKSNNTDDNETPR